MRRIRAYSWAALVVGAWGCGGTEWAEDSSPRRTQVEAVENKPWGDPGAVIAEVNGVQITRGEFYVRVLRQFGTWQLLSGLIKQELFLQEAARLKVRVESAEVEARADEILADMAAKLTGGEAALRQSFTREGLSLEEVRRDLVREVSIQLLIGKVTKAMRAPGDRELEEYYKRTYRHTRYETRHVAYSFALRPGQMEEDRPRLKLEAHGRAARAAGRLRSGADFAALARAESEDSVTAESGGRLGPIHEESPMDPVLKKAIFALAEGEVSEPVENPNGGYHVFQVTRIIPEESFADCKETMRRELLEREPDVAEIEAALEVLRGRADVKLFGLPIMSAAAAPPAAGGGGKSGGGP